MEDVFNILQKEGKNDVDGLMKWMQDTKLIDATKEGEAQAQKLFADAANPNDIGLDKFKEALLKLAAEQNKTFEEISQKLIEAAPKLLSAIAGGVVALKESITGGSK